MTKGAGPLLKVVKQTLQFKRRREGEELGMRKDERREKGGRKGEGRRGGREGPIEGSLQVLAILKMQSPGHMILRKKDDQGADESVLRFLSPPKAASIGITSQCHFSLPIVHFTVYPLLLTMVQM